MDFQSKNLTIPRGKAMFAKYLPGTQTPGPFRDLGNCPEFTLARESETLAHYSSQRGLRERDEEITIEATLNGSVVTDDLKMENVAFWFMSTVNKVTVVASAGQTETFQNPAVGDSYQLGRTNAAPSGARMLADVTVTGAGATALVAGTDYEVDPELGILTILSTAAAGASITVTYDVEASTRDQIVAGDQQIEGELKFVSFNATGPQADITIPRARLTPNGDLPLVNDPESTEFVTLPLGITVLKKGNLALAYRDGRPAA